MDENEKFTNEMMERLFSWKIPESKKDYDAFYKMMPAVIAALPRVKGISTEEIDRVKRIWKDIVDLSAIEGAERVMASDMIHLLSEMRALVVSGGFPKPGVTGISVMISPRPKNQGFFSLFEGPKHFDPIYNNPLCSMCSHQWNCNKGLPCIESEKFRKFLMDLITIYLNVYVLYTLTYIHNG